MVGFFHCDQGIRWQEPLAFIVLVTQHTGHFWPVHLYHADHLAVLDPGKSLGMHRSCKLWSFSTTPSLTFSLAMFRMSGNCWWWSLAPNLCHGVQVLTPYLICVRPTLDHAPEELCYCSLIATESSIPFHSRTQHISSSSFLSFSFPRHAPLSFFCPKIPRFCAHCSLSLSPTSVTKSSWKDPLFSHSVVITTVSTHSLMWQMSTALKT